MISNLMPKQALTALLETVFNKALALDPHIKPALTKLEGKTLSIELSELEFPLSFTVANGQITVTTLVIKNNCFLQTSLKRLPEIKHAQALTELIKADQLVMEGDLKVAQQFVSLAEQLDIDWQQQLALRIGDVATHKLTHFGNVLKEKLDFAKQQIEADASEYILHEQQLACSSSEVDIYSKAVTKVAQDAEQLTARIAKLQQLLIKQ